MGSHSLLQGIFLTQGSNSGLLICRQILCCLVPKCLHFLNEEKKVDLGTLSKALDMGWKVSGHQFLHVEKKCVGVFPLSSVSPSKSWTPAGEPMIQLKSNTSYQREHQISQVKGSDPLPLFSFRDQLQSPVYHLCFRPTGYR